jgi:hypothetical protein
VVGRELREVREQVRGVRPRHLGEQEVHRHRLARFVPERAGVEPLVQVDPEAGRLRVRVGPGAVQDLDQVLLEVRGLDALGERDGGQGRHEDEDEGDALHCDLRSPPAPGADQDPLRAFTNALRTFSAVVPAFEQASLQEAGEAG